VTLAMQCESELTLGDVVGPGRLVELVCRGKQITSHQSVKQWTASVFMSVFATDSAWYVLKMFDVLLLGISVPSKTWPTQIVLCCGTNGGEIPISLCPGCASATSNCDGSLEIKIGQIAVER